MATQTIGANPNPDARYLVNDSTFNGFQGTLTTQVLTVNTSATIPSLTVSGTMALPAATTVGAGGGTGVIGITGNVNTQVAIGTAASSGNDTTEDTIFTYTLPASTLTGTRVITVIASGTLKADSSTKTTKMYFGTTVLSVGTGTQSGISWRGQMEIIRSGASTQIITNSASYGGTITAPTVVAGADTDTGTIVIKVTGQNTGTASVNAVQGNFFAVTVEN